MNFTPLHHHLGIAVAQWLTLYIIIWGRGSTMVNPLHHHLGIAVAQWLTL